MAAQEVAESLHRLARLGERALAGEDVPEARPHLQRGVHAGGAGARHQPPRVVQQQLVLAHLDEERRQAAQVGVERRGEGVAGVSVTQLLARLEVEPLGREARVDAGLGAHRLAGAGEIGPRRDAGQRGREGQAGVPGADRERHRQPAAG